MNTVGVARIGRRGSAGSAESGTQRSFQRRISGIMVWLKMGDEGKNNVNDKYSKKRQCLRDHFDG